MFSPDIAINSFKKANIMGIYCENFWIFTVGTGSPYTESYYVFRQHLNARIEYEYDRIKFPREFSDNASSLFQSNLLRLILSYYFSIYIIC